MDFQNIPNHCFSNFCNEDPYEEIYSTMTYYLAEYIIYFPSAHFLM